MTNSNEHDSDPRSWTETPVPARVLIVAAITVSVFGLLCSLLLDGGIAFRIFLVSLIAHCGLTSLLVLRRPQTLTVLDRLLIQFGIFPIFLLFLAIQNTLS